MITLARNAMGAELFTQRTKIQEGATWKRNTDARLAKVRGIITNQKKKTNESRNYQADQNQHLRKDRDWETTPHPSHSGQV